MDAPGFATLFLWAFVGYFAGSVPFGLILTRMAGLGDIRQIGSGNIGATNVLRSGHKGIAALTLLLDALKATLPVLLAGHVAGPVAAAVTSVAAFAGHIFPVWLGFRGGKGVATYLGGLIGLSLPVALVFAAVWLAMAFTARISSAAALTAAVAAVFAALQWTPQPVALAIAAMGAFLFYTHRANIGRLLRGEESKINLGRR
ncbi:MAG: glycerol-3-phosphate 1-O-acyltransferase PlsY [Hyphomicrobiales bacterium]